MSFDSKPAVQWETLKSLTVLGGEIFELPAGEIENHLGQDAEGSLELFYRALSPELDIRESLTHSVLSDLDPDQCMIMESPAGFMLQLCGAVLETRSERGSKGWKNSTQSGTTLSFHSSDRELLKQTRCKLIGKEKAAVLQAAEDTQSKLVEQFAALDPSEHEAAGAAMAGSVLREAMKMLESDEGEPDEMSAKIMGGLLSGIEKMVQGLEEKAEAGGLSEKSTEALGDLMKDMISED